MQQSQKINQELTLQYPGYRHCSIRFHSVDSALNDGDVYLVDSIFQKLSMPVSEILSDKDADAILWIPAGESAKQWTEVERILQFFHEHHLVRDSMVTIIGGGTLCDLGAFAASIYLRGVRLQLIPTTLLAMVDAAIGGKTGINFNAIKNIVGTFYPADLVSIDMRFLNFLQENQRREGFAEVIKAGLLGDAELLALLEARADGLLTSASEGYLAEIVWRAIKVKHTIVEEDFKEIGKRAFLNLGHTFAHALEASTTEYSHGLAVGWGLRCAAELSKQIGLADSDYCTQVNSLLDRFDYPSKVSVDLQSLEHAMQFDKKRNKKELRFVLQSALGQTALHSVPYDDLHAVLLARTYRR